MSYLAIWCQQPLAALQAARVAHERTGLEHVFESACFHVLTARRDHCSSDHERYTVVLGQIFSREATPKRIAEITPSLAMALDMDKRTDPFAALWGAYLLCKPDGRGGLLKVGRDPSGLLPCYFVRHGGLTLIASSIELIAAGSNYRPEIDWAALGKQLATVDVLPEATCLAGVRELLPGRTLSVDASCTIVSERWSPFAFTGHKGGQTRRKAAEELHETVSGCVSAWASEFGNIVLSASGGLDSSIVAACLAGRGHRFGAMTMVANDPDGDERDYALPLFAALRIPFQEARYHPDDVDLARSSSQHLPRPLGHPYVQALAARLNQYRYDIGADAHFTGLAGDNVFCAIRSAIPLVDILHLGGLRGRFSDTFADVRHLTGLSARGAVRECLQLLLGGRHPSSPVGPVDLLSAHVLATSTSSDQHSWITSAREIPLGRAYHAEIIARVQPFANAFPSSPLMPTIAPFLSAPIIELCLGIPSWFWCAEGQDRSIARLAFRDHLPTAIVKKRSKGGPDAFGRDLCRSRQEEIRSRLLDGRLAREGVIDRQSVESALEDDSLLRNGLQNEILSLIDAESWVTHWESRVRPN